MRTSKLLRGVQPVKTRCTCDPSVKHRRDSSSDVDDDDDDANGFSFYGDLCPQCTIVQNELRAVEEKAKTAKGTGKRGEGPAREPVGESGTAARKVRTTGTSRVLDNELMSGAPFLPPERHSMLKDALRMQEAAKWLAICPRGTLRVLQQRVLCATAEHFISFAGMPSHIAELIEANGGTVPGKKPAGSDDDIDSVIQPPPPLSFTSFMSDFLALNVDVERVTPVEVSKTKNIDGADVITSLYIRGLLQTGRALPVAPLSSVNLFYSSLPAEEALAHTVVTVVENQESQLNSTRGTDTARKYKKNVERKVSPFTYIERDQALLSDVVHWATFFATFFDEARESQCREPMSLFCSILLACAIAGRAELNETPEAVMEHTTAQLRREDPSYTHCATCTACMHRQLWVKEQCHFQVLAGMPTHNDYVRFFLGTPAVVLWVESFLQLYRVGQVMRRKRRTSSGELTNGLDEPDDDIRPGEAYLVRDWIAAESRCDAEGFSRQKVNGYFCVPLSSEAGRNKVVKVGFSSNSVDLVVEKVSSWVDSGVKHGHPLKVSALLQLLREGFPVLPYYMTFFAPERRS